jgi:hypothetical protein
MAGLKTKRKLQAAGREMRDNPPAILAKTRRKFGAERAEAQRKAILISKARRSGAKIPRKRSSKE